MSSFQWAVSLPIAIYDTKEEATTIAGEYLGGRLVYSGDYQKMVESYCVLGPVGECIRRIEEYLDAGARHFILGGACPLEDRPRHMETVAKEIIPHFRG